MQRFIVEPTKIEFSTKPRHHTVTFRIRSGDEVFALSVEVEHVAGVAAIYEKAHDALITQLEGWTEAARDAADRARRHLPEA